MNEHARYAQLEQDLAATRQQLARTQSALGLLGVKFCAHCGKPHKSGVTESIELRRNGGVSPARVTLCMDEPGASCFLAGTTLREPPATPDSDPTRSAPKLDPTFVDIEDTLAMWTLANSAHIADHPLHGLVEEVITGKTLLDDHQFAVRLVYHWPARLGGFRLLAGDSPRDLLEACGRRFSDIEYAHMIDFCQAYAVHKKHRVQVRVFTAIQDGASCLHLG